MRRAMAAALVVTAITGAHAMYLAVDVENVPVARLVANLERLIGERPNDPHLHLNLARTHAMAWAQKTEQTAVAKRNPEWGPWFGHEPNRVPFTLVTTTDEARLKAAAPHLQAALREYDEAIRLEPANFIALLGKAWLTEKSGDRARAVELYRAIIDRAWVADQQTVTLGLRVTEETAGYLLPLLDPQRDATEIAELRRRLELLGKLGRAVTPIAVPLRDGLTFDQVVAPHARVAFDADGSGFRKSWSWITPNAGWLVYNQRDDASIASALQMFGNVTFWLFWNNGYDALCALDDDGDNALAGTELAHMSIWRDVNSNGRADRGEVQPLRDWGITTLSCRYDLVDDADAAAWSPAGVSFVGGGTRPTWDVLLHERK